MPSARHISFSVENFYIEFILTFYIIYFIRFFIYIGVKPVNNVVLVSDGQQSGSVYVYSFLRFSPIKGYYKILGSALKNVFWSTEVFNFYKVIFINLFLCWIMLNPGS